MAPLYVYLHGFASSPFSTKAAFFRERFADLGLHLEIPELDEGCFEQMTITSQLSVIDRTVRGRASVLLGSSLGGWLAALYAAGNPEVERVVLMAPAFGFVSLFGDMIGPDALREWRATGVLAVHHYGTGRDRLLPLAFFEDAARYEGFPRLSQVALILHGSNDDSVPVENSIRYAREHVNVSLVKLETAHEMTDVMDRLWSETVSFLDLRGSAHEADKPLGI